MFVQLFFHFSRMNTIQSASLQFTVIFHPFCHYITFLRTSSHFFLYTCQATMLCATSFDQEAAHMAPSMRGPTHTFRKKLLPHLAGEVVSANDKATASTEAGRAKRGARGEEK